MVSAVPPETHVGRVISPRTEPHRGVARATAPAVVAASISAAIQHCHLVQTVCPKCTGWTSPRTPGRVRR
jgi:hypothetical protein